MSEVQTVSATVHEIAHSKLHNQKKIQIANDEQYQEIELFDKPGLFSLSLIHIYPPFRASAKSSLLPFRANIDIFNLPFRASLC